MTYDQWLNSVPGELKDDPIWRSEVYRLSVFAIDLAWPPGWMTLLIGAVLAVLSAWPQRGPNALWLALGVCYVIPACEAALSIRAQAADDPARPSPRPVVIPSPEELGLPSGAVLEPQPAVPDWAAAHARLDRLGPAHLESEQSVLWHQLTTS